MLYEAWKAFFAYMRQRTEVSVADSIDIKVGDK